MTFFAHNNNNVWKRETIEKVLLKYGKAPKIVRKKIIWEALEKEYFKEIAFNCHMRLSDFVVVVVVWNEILLLYGIIDVKIHLLFCLQPISLKWIRQRKKTGEYW